MVLWCLKLILHPKKLKGFQLGLGEYWIRWSLDGSSFLLTKSLFFEFDSRHILTWPWQSCFGSLKFQKVKIFLWFLAHSRLNTQERMQAQSVLVLPSTLLFGFFVWYVPSPWTISSYTALASQNWYVFLAFLICMSVYPSGWIGGYLNPSTIGVWKEKVLNQS